MSVFDPAEIEVASISDTGRQRANNQDAYGEGRAPSGARLIIVADGMGGHQGGETASRIAVETVRDFVATSEDPPSVALRSALEHANRTVHGEAQRVAELAGMGTTGVAVLFSTSGEAFVGNVGDSRAYRLRERELQQITQDHSLVAELQRRGILSEEEAAVHPRRNEVLRSLGVEPEVTVDVHELDLAGGDLFLLCSDGLSGVVTDEEIGEVMGREPPAQAVRTLVDLANERGGPDNVTVQIARVPNPAAETRPVPSLPSPPAAEADPADSSPDRRALAALFAAAFALGLWWWLGSEPSPPPEPDGAAAGAIELPELPPAAKSPIAAPEPDVQAEPAAPSTDAEAASPSRERVDAEEVELPPEPGVPGTAP